MNRFPENLSFSSLLLNPVVSETLKVIDSAHSKRLALPPQEGGERNKKCEKMEKLKFSPYDILATIIHYGPNKDYNVKGCYVSPGEQMLLLNAFSKAGYLSQKKKIDTSAIDKYIEKNNSRDVLSQPPPYIVSFQKYRNLLVGTKGSTLPSLSSILSSASEEYNLVFIMFSSTNAGGKSVGEWYCKSNLFIYLLCLHYRIPAMLNKGLIIVNQRLGDPRFVFKTLTKYEKEDKKPFLFCNIADGVYSGSEANNFAIWWSNRSKLRNAHMCIFTPICQIPCRDYHGPISVGSFDGENINENINEKHKVRLIAAKGVPSGMDRETRSFLLPFKIADGLSISKYSEILRKSNKTFVPSYKLNTMCNDNASAESRKAAEQKVLARGDFIKIKTPLRKLRDDEATKKRAQMNSKRIR